VGPVRARCPECGRPTEVAPSNPWRPFCSERCRLLDLGAWLDGSRAIAGEAATPPEASGGAGADEEPS